MTTYITYPGLGKIPPVTMEEVALTKEDVLFHLRTEDEPYMIVSEEGSWTHLLGCVLAYVLQKDHIFSACLESYVMELSRMNQEKLNLFMPVLRKRHTK